MLAAGTNPAQPLTSGAGVTLSSIESTMGSIVVTGNASGNGVQAFGTRQISTMHDGDITITGTSATASGVVLNGPKSAGSDLVVETDNGTISIAGTSKARNYAGVAIGRGVSIKSTGTDGGGVSISGINSGTNGSGSVGLGVGMGSSSGFGVSIRTNGTAGAGGITVKGTTNMGYGIFLTGSAITLNTVNGDIAITGTTAGNIPNLEWGVIFTLGVSIATSGTGESVGSITITGTDSSSASGAAVSLQGGTIRTADVGADAGGITIKGNIGKQCRCRGFVFVDDRDGRWRDLDYRRYHGHPRNCRRPVDRRSHYQIDRQRRRRRFDQRFRRGR